MPSLLLAALTFIAALASGFAGFALARTLPDTHSTGRSRDMLCGVAGLTGLMLALTLSLSIGSAIGVARAQTAAIQRLAAEALQFDLALRPYGPQAADARRGLGAEMAVADAEIRGAGAETVAAAAAGVAQMQALLAGLKPADDAQRQSLAAAERHYGELGETRLAMALPSADPVASPLVLMTLAWACLLFGCLGVLSRANATTVTALALGGAAVSSAIWFALELSQPLSGALRPSAAAIEQTMVEIAQ
jgi:hypothetical protein